VVYERVLIRWQRVMPLEMLWFTNVFQVEGKIDKRGHLQRFIQGSGKHTQEGFKFERQRILLKATCLSIHYYNTIEKSSRTLQLEFETTRHDRIHAVTWHEDVLSSQLL
jgi:hypothetical protein